MKKNSLAFIFCFVLLASVRATFAEEVYAMQVDSRGFRIDSVSQMRWWSDVIFFNHGAADAEIRLLGVSNGQLGSPGPEFRSSFLIPPRRSASLSQILTEPWRPNPAPGAISDVPLWLVHLDVRGNVVVESTMFSGFEKIIGPPFRFADYGRLSLPVFRSLTPANEPKVHLGADLGPRIPARINVGIYNASQTSDANASIEIRRGCDDGLLESRNVSIPRNTIIQFSGFNGAHECPPSTPGPHLGSSFIDQAVYAIITVDQPSLSYIAVLANDRLPEMGMTIPTRP